MVWVQIWLLSKSLEIFPNAYTFILSLPFIPAANIISRFPAGVRFTCSSVIPATTFDFIRKVKKTFLTSQQISNSTSFAKINSNESNKDSLYTYSTYYMLGTMLNMLYIIIHLNIYLR